MTARSAAPLVAMMVGLGMTLGAPPAGADKAAHALAQRFVDGAAKEAARRKEAEDAKRRAAEEAEMLARARAEAEERKAAAAKARAEEKAREARGLAEEERVRKAKLAEEQRRAREQFIAQQIRAAEKAEEERERAEAARVAAEKRRAEDKRKRAEAARMAAEEKRIAEEKRAAEDERRRAEAARIAERKRLAEERRIAAEKRRAEQRRQALAAEHDAAHARRAERMRQLKQERQARERTATAAKPPEIEEPASEPSNIDPPMGLGAFPSDRPGTEKPVKDAVPRRALADTRPAKPPERVTILLSIEPGKTGIRRFGKKTADPVLCAGHTCWIAAGTGRAAREVTRGLALGPANTMGRRAAACNRHLTCVFRDVDLDAPSADIQPIDLRILRHDRRKPLRLEADPSCRLVNGALACDKLFVARSWRAWVIDEELARKAGPEALESALKRGLAPAQSAALGAEHY